ncbi:hypothetical protein AFERRID_12240 [Acidithiobacillus ferridurans]|uniref:Uncharacterized protein n=1 Tax=Acidithiobacillus ferridurans TaxID=1232575 RepID=A0A2Z6IHZ3_ACIFI|nr:hypothetical protein AFERRID_12240 [Acidithiobacillus ferridurans]
MQPQIQRLQTDPQQNGGTAPIPFGLIEHLPQQCGLRRVERGRYGDYRRQRQPVAFRHWAAGGGHPIVEQHPFLLEGKAPLQNIFQLANVAGEGVTTQPLQSAWG